MASLMMASLNRTGVPADESVVRNTATPVDINAPAAEQESAPDRNEFESDPNPNLGMVPRQLASHVIPTEKYSPFWSGEVDDSHNYNDIVNRQVSSSGTAAAREASGQFGHGTMQVMEGIEPVADLIDGGSYGNTYFVANDPKIQSSSGSYMTTPPGQDYTIPGLVAGVGKTNARDAAEASMYNVWYNGVGN